MFYWLMYDCGVASPQAVVGEWLSSCPSGPSMALVHLRRIVK